MSNFRVLGTVFVVYLQGMSQASAVQISLSGDKVERYFLILEHYVLPFLVVSTIVLLCGYAASRIRNRKRRRDSVDDDFGMSNGSPEEGTAAFLRELRSTPPIEDTEPDLASEPRLRLRRAGHPKKKAGRPKSPVAPYFTIPAAEEDELVGTDDDGPLLLNDPATTGPDARSGAGQGDGRVYGLPPRPQRAATPPTEDDRAAAAHENDASRAVTPESLPTDMAAPRHERSLHAADKAASSTAVPQDDRHRRSGAAPSRGRAQSSSPPPPSAKRSRPLVARSQRWSDLDDDKPAEPVAKTVRRLKATSGGTTAADLEAAQVMAADIANALDYITTILQQCLATLAERIKLKDGLQLDEVRRMRISAFDPPPDLSDRLGALGLEVVNAVQRGYARVERFNQIVGRLEQMAEEEPLDEGWNDLVRQRLSETIYAIGQVKKQLAAVLPADVDATNGDGDGNSALDQDHPTPGRGVPFGGRRG